MVTQPLLVNKFFPNISSKPPWHNLTLSPLVLTLAVGEKRLTLSLQVAVEIFLTLMVPHFERPPRTRQNMLFWDCMQCTSIFTFTEVITNEPKLICFTWIPLRAQCCCMQQNYFLKFSFHTEEKKLRFTSRFSSSHAHPSLFQRQIFLMRYQLLQC